MDWETCMWTERSKHCERFRGATGSKRVQTQIISPQRPHLPVPITFLPLALHVSGLINLLGCHINRLWIHSEMAEETESWESLGDEPALPAEKDLALDGGSWWMLTTGLIGAATTVGWYFFTRVGNNATGSKAAEKEKKRKKGRTTAKARVSPRSHVGL
jgi:hypothetical protein